MKPGIATTLLWITQFLAQPTHAKECQEIKAARHELLPITEHVPNAIAIEKVNESTPVETVWRSYYEIPRDETTSDEVKISQKIRILVVAHNYINTHSRPEGVVPWNIKPPDGGTSGASPESVEDPKLRAQYVKKLEENNAKAEAQNTYDAFVALQNQILMEGVVYTSAKPENARILSEAITKSSKDTNQAETLKRLLTDKAVEQHKQLPKWPIK
jgi:hypothetical protein